MKKILVFIFCSIVCLAQAQSLFPESKKGLLGYKKAGTKRWIIKPKFQDAKKFGEMGLDSSLAFAKQNNLWGVIDQKGVWQIAPIYDSILVKKYNEILFGLTFSKTTQMFAVLNNKGKKQTIDFESEILHTDINERGYVILTQSNVQSDQKFLYQISDKQFIETELKNFQRLEKVNKNLFSFKKNGLRGLFLCRSKPVLIEGYPEIWWIYNISSLGVINFNEKADFVVAFKGNYLQKINLTNLKIESLGDYDVATDLYPSIFYVSKNNKIGIVSENGAELLPLEYDEMEYMEYKQGRKGYKIKKKGLTGIFDVYAKQVVAEPIYQSVTPFNCLVSRNSYLLLEKDNKKYLFSEIDRKITMAGDDITCLKTPADATNHFSLIIIQKNKKAAILENFTSSKVSNFYDKIVIERSKGKPVSILINSGEYVYEYDLVGYNGSQKTYINPETFETSKKPFEADIKQSSSP